MSDVAPRMVARPQRNVRRTWRLFARNRLAAVSLVLIIAFYLAALFAPLVAGHDPLAMDLANAFSPPGQGGHLLGTDNFGRDILARLIYGSRISLTAGLLVVAIAAGIGTLLGLLAGYVRGWVDILIMRLVEIFFAFPFLVLVVAVIAVLGPNIVNVVWVLGLVSWPIYTRLVRAQVLSLREREFVEASRATGSSTGRILFRHILPNCLTPILVTATFGVPQAILALSALGFLGLGVQPPTPEWGTMINEGKNYLLQAPLQIVWPGAAVMLIVMSFNFLGDGLGEAFNPRARKH